MTRRRLRGCVERRPGAEIDGDYDPRCCRFPKSCSASVYDDDRVTDEDLEPVEPAHEPAPEMLASAPRRRGVVLVDEERLARLLALPPAWRLLGFQPFPMRLSIGVLVEGPNLPECPPGREPPFVEPPAPSGGEVQARLLPLFRAAIAGAIGRCEHPDPGGPIYDPVRPCPECAAAAVVELLAGPALEVTFTR